MRKNRERNHLTTSVLACPPVFVHFVLQLLFVADKLFLMLLPHALVAEQLLAVTVVLVVFVNLPVDDLRGPDRREPALQADRITWHCDATITTTAFEKRPHAHGNIVTQTEVIHRALQSTFSSVSNNVTGLCSKATTAKPGDYDGASGRIAKTSLIARSRH